MAVFAPHAYVCNSYHPTTHTMQQKACQEWEDKAVVLSSKKVKQKQAMLKTQKSISSSKCTGSSGNSDDNNNFMPMKKATTAKAYKLIAPMGGILHIRLKAKSSGGEMSLLNDNSSILSQLHTMLSALGSNASGSVVLAFSAMLMSLMLAVPSVGAGNSMHRLRRSKGCICTSPKGLFPST